MEHYKDETQMFDTASSGTPTLIQTSTLEKAMKYNVQPSLHLKIAMEIGT